jgi:hypothetical protein
MSAVTGWNLPRRCAKCGEREDAWCWKFLRSIWIAWRMIGGCDITGRYKHERPT